MSGVRNDDAPTNVAHSVGANPNKSGGANRGEVLTLKRWRPALHKCSLEGSTNDVPKFNAQNERIKHRYFNFLSEAKQLSTGTVDQVAAALADFEQSTGHRDFRLFRSEQAQSHKHRLTKAD